MNFVKVIKKNPNSNISFYLSLLPIFNMAIKLINRKNSGKKPFSKEFNSNKVIGLIEQATKKINSCVKNEKCNIEQILLKEISDKLVLATREIKSYSLAKDFVYLSKQINDVISITKLKF